jgi:hypothetical protein
MQIEVTQPNYGATNVARIPLQDCMTVEAVPL